MSVCEDFSTKKGHTVLYREKTLKLLPSCPPACVALYLRYIKHNKLPKQGVQFNLTCNKEYICTKSVYFKLCATMYFKNNVSQIHYRSYHIL